MRVIRHPTELVNNSWLNSRILVIAREQYEDTLASAFLNTVERSLFSCLRVAFEAAAALSFLHSHLIVVR